MLVDVSKVNSRVTVGVFQDTDNDVIGVLVGNTGVDVVVAAVVDAVVGEPVDDNTTFLGGTTRGETTECQADNECKEVSAKPRSWRTMESLHDYPLEEIFEDSVCTPHNNECRAETSEHCGRHYLITLTSVRACSSI